MVDSVKTYMPTILQFSSSRLFFQNQTQLLQKFGFISPSSIDIHFKYTFQQVFNYHFIQGGEFEGLTIDHQIYEKGIVYKLGFKYPKYQNVKCLSVDLTDCSRVESSMRSLLKSFPFVSWGLFLLLLMLLYFSKVGQFLFWLNIIGAGILFLFSIWKMVKMFCKTAVNTKMTDYKGLPVNYDGEEDVLFLSPNMIKTLQFLSKNYQIMKIGYTGNCLYLLQSIYAPQEDNSNLFKKVVISQRTYSEPEKAELQQKTLEYFQQSDFLSQFSSY